MGGVGGRVDIGSMMGTTAEMRGAGGVAKGTVWPPATVCGVAKGLGPARVPRGVVGTVRLRPAIAKAAESAAGAGGVAKGTGSATETVGTGACGVAKGLVVPRGLVGMVRLSPAIA